MKTIIVIGEKFQQSQKLNYILDNIENCEIYFTKIENNLLDQIKDIQKKYRNANIIYEIKKLNNQEQDNVIQKLKKANKLISKIVLLSNDLANEEAQKMMKQLQQNLSVSIYKLEDYFKQNYGYDKHTDLSGMKIAMFISKEQYAKNLIFQTVKSPIRLQNQWALINTPQFNINENFEQKTETINEFSKIFQTYQNQISLFFIIIDQEKNDTVKKNFLEIFSQLREFKQKIIVLLYDRCDENFEENLNLNNYFLNVAKIKKVYKLTNNQLQNQESINEYFSQILKEQEVGIKMGIDMKNTNFEIKDETQSEIEKQSSEQNFQKAKLQQLKQSVDQHDEQINLYKQKIQEYQQKIKEHDRLKYEQEYQIRELERDIVQKQKIIDKIQKETQKLSQNLQEVKIPQQKENSEIIHIKDSLSIDKTIEDLEMQEQQKTYQLQEALQKQEKFDNVGSAEKSQEQEELQFYISDLLKQIDEINSTKQKYKTLKVQVSQGTKKDDQNIEKQNNEQKRGNTTSLNEISRKNYQYGTNQQKQFQQIY